MPLVDSNLQATWDAQYSCQIGGSTVHYARSAMERIIGNDADVLIDALIGLGLTVGQRIGLIGAGFGWVAERFVARGFGPMSDGTANGKICAVDTSTWIQANKTGNANVSILNADVNASTGRRTIRQQFGSNTAEVHWVVSEDVLPVLIGVGPTPGGNNEVVPFCNSLRSLASTGVAHWVTVATPSGIAGLNWKTLSEWKAWVTPDFVIARDGSGVL